MTASIFFSPSIAWILLSTATIVSLTAADIVSAETNADVSINRSKKFYKYDEAIKITYDIPNVKGTNYVAIYKKKSTVKWGKESFWTSLCNGGDQTSWPCDVPTATGDVVFSRKNSNSKGGDGTDWPPPKGKYKACLLNRNVPGNGVTKLKCTSFTVKGVKKSAWKSSSVVATRSTFNEGDAVTANFTLKKKKDAVTNLFVGLYKGEKPTAPLTTDAVSWVYAACNNQEGNQLLTNYCTKKRKKGLVSITDAAVTKGQYYLCLIFDHNKPHRSIKCSSKQITIETGIDITSSPTTSPITYLPTSSSPTMVTTADPTGTFDETPAPTPVSSFILAPWIHHSGLTYTTLDCNEKAAVDIDSQDCLDNAISFSSIYDSSSIDPLTVPCGKCVLMDYTDGSTLEIPGGLHVLGRLHFDPLSSVIVRTTGVFVQGSWSMKIPNEGNQVKILLHGFEEQTLYPHDLCCTGNVFHMDVCDEECEDKQGVGKKPFVVAGGKLDIRAVDPTCKSWTKLQAMDADTLNTVTLDVNFAKCLRPEDNLLFTTDQKSLEGKALRTVASVNKVTGVVLLQTAMPRLYPTVEGPGESYLATEVALLRRDVIFEAEVEPQDEEIGGHSIVFHTPFLEQVIQGVQFENFGQAGVLGRYPIHFHKSGDSPSLISKNLITNSNQRCIFIHNTNNATIDDNVAYNTAGHCYATETGAEHHNFFTNNLGAHTKKLWRSNGQSDSAVGFHKHQAATFWLRNMENTFTGNVAAGSESMGFWIEMPDITGNQLNSGSFRNNVAHSCKSEGLITYKKGWKPIKPGVIDGFISYNNNEGVKVHITGNIIMTNFLLVDNVVGIRYGAWNSGVVLKDSSIVAFSQDAKLRRGRTRGHYCIGVESSFNDQPYRMGRLMLDNVTFVDFNCLVARVLDHRWHNLMTADMGDPFGYKDVVITGSEEKTKPIFECDDPHWQNVFMEDNESTFGPADKGAGFLIRNNDRMKAFLPEEACEVVPYDVEDKCTAFCEGVCMRLVWVLPGGKSSKIGYKELKLTHSDTGKEYTFAVLENGKAVLVLPPGKYEGDYIDVNGDLMVLDTVAVQTFRAPECGDFTPDINFSTMPPTISPTAGPTKSANPSYSIFYVEAGENVKCPSGDTRLFKYNSAHTVDECHQLCYNEPGCAYFSVIQDSGECIGCTTNSSPLPTSSGIISYQLIVFKWFWPAGDNLKCPYDDSRLFKFTAEKNIVDCWLKCYDRPGCDYFTHKVANGDCMGCSSDALPLESGTGFQAYRIETYRDFPYILIEDRKCPPDNRFDKTKTSTRDDCWQLCVGTFGCVSFTYGEGNKLSSTDDGTCILCNSIDSYERHVGFNTYDLK